MILLLYTVPIRVTDKRRPSKQIISSRYIAWLPNIFYVSSLFPLFRRSDRAISNDKDNFERREDIKFKFDNLNLTIDD